MMNPHFRFALVVSRFNETITDTLLQGALQRFAECHITQHQIDVYYVPGAIEIPLMAQTIARKKQHHSILCLGAVIRGQTSHYDYVCQQVSAGCQRVALDEGLPIIFGVLTTENEAQAWDRLGGAYGHKGRESVDAALAMVQALEQAALT